MGRGAPELLAAVDVDSMRRNTFDGVRIRENMVDVQVQDKSVTPSRGKRVRIYRPMTLVPFSALRPHAQNTTFASINSLGESQSYIA
jgi:hypothetical protein